MPTQPPWPTTMRSRLVDGRCIGTNGSVWLYRAVPMAPVVDAVSPAASLEASEPISYAIEELASMTTVHLPRRMTAKSSYRQVHVLLVNLPRPFRPPPESPLAGYLSANFGGVNVSRRVLLLGVKLVDKVGGQGGLRAAVDSVVETLATGTVPLSDFDADFAAVDERLTRSGLTIPTDEQFRMAAAWWNHGDNPDTPILVHSDHLHVFLTAAAATSAAEIGGDKCQNWLDLAEHHTLSFGCVREFDLPFVSTSDWRARWASSIVDSGAVAISIRALVEPASVTRAELRRRRKQYMDDVVERAQANKMGRAEQEGMLSDLTEMEGVYAEGGPATLMDCSVLTAFSGSDPRTGFDLSETRAGPSVLLSSMVARQDSALLDTMLCSPVRSVPYLHDLPAQAVATSGLPSLSVVGDIDGALVGLTERDRQPAWISPTAASTADGTPLALVAGQSGSGKTMLMLYLADQFARLGRPVIVIDPKQDSNHDAAVLASGGQVLSLDSVVQADGAFDPMRFAARKEIGVELASSMLMSINPWGTMRADYETPLITALSYGAENGAECTGQALQIALDAGVAPPEMVRRVMDLAGASPMFRACVGVEPGTAALRVAEGITLIKVGQSHLDLPEPGAIGDASQQQRVALGLVRMMIFGSAMALTGRSGVLMVDEAWVFLGSGGRREVERLGRLARSQQVLPMLFTQRVTDATDAGLTGYISRGLILPISDPVEAAAACELFRLEPTPERMSRITALATVGGTTAGEDGAPNWSSMRALRDPATRKVLRGSVAIYADLSGRALPVEIVIPPRFLELASTNPEDIRRRLATEPGAETGPVDNPQYPEVEATPDGGEEDPWSEW